MCGIFTSITEKNSTFNLDASKRGIIHRYQRHRGPDEKNQLSVKCLGKNVELLHQRLSIIDIETGSQPMTSSDGRYTIVFNGEIFNYKELRQKLARSRCRFHTDHSDTEVVLNLYAFHGPEMLKELRGFFSFAIFDKKKGQVFFARDRFGIKPFYYIHQANTFLVASELKTLLALVEAPRVSQQSLIYYLSFQFIPAPDTIFEGVHKLPAAHYGIYDMEKASLTIRRFWDIHPEHKKEHSAAQWEEIVSEKIQEAVNVWSESDVEVGASLSGGLDSSTIVALFAKRNRQKIKTFTLGFEDSPELDECRLARKVAKKYETEHFECRLKPSDILNELDQMVYHLDEPYGGGLPSWYVFKMMRGKVKVAFTGVGGDELFGNYRKWRIYERNRFLAFCETCVRKKMSPQKLASLMRRYPLGSFYHRYFTGDAIFSIVQGCDDSCELPEALLERVRGECPSEDYRDVVPYMDTKMQLPEEFLLMVDRFSMAFSIEARTPFLDHELFELVMSMPSRIRTNAQDPKYFLRRIAHNVLPEEVLRAGKKGFILPVAQWTRGPLRGQIEEVLGTRYLNRQGIFSPAIYNRYVKPHMAGRQDNSSFIWTLFMFQKWHQRFMN